MGLKNDYLHIILKIICGKTVSIGNNGNSPLRYTVGCSKIERREVEKRIYGVRKAAAHGFRRLS